MGINALCSLYSPCSSHINRHQLSPTEIDLYSYTLSNIMDTFLSTAWRYLRGESGLPSLLPAKESVEMAKEKCREVRLFCEGLEKFREILYTEPVVSR